MAGKITGHRGDWRIVQPEKHDPDRHDVRDMFVKGYGLVFVCKGQQAAEECAELMNKILAPGVAYDVWTA